MTSLEMSVALMAAVAVLPVIGYNLWISRKRGRDRQLPASKSATQAEPTLSEALGVDGADSVSVADRGAGATVDGGWSTPVAARAEAAAATPASSAAESAPAEPLLDPSIDCIVTMILPTPVPGARLQTMAGAFRRAGGRPVIIEASPVGMQRWRAPVAGSLYGEVRIGVLLANRHGPLNAMEFEDFAAGAQSIARQLSASCELPDMNAVLASARALDEICAQLDGLVGIGIALPSPIGDMRLAGLATLLGCHERGPNQYVRLGPAGDVLFSLGFGETLDQLVLLLDLPRAAAPHACWLAMIECARICAGQIGGTLVDDAGRPLDDAQLTMIGTETAAHARALEEAGITPGSMRALRLFS